MVSLQLVKRTAARWWFLLIAVFALPVGAAAALIKYSDPLYEASSWILVNPSRTSQPVAAGEDQRSAPDQALRTQLSIALSEEVIRQTIRRIKPETLLRTSTNPDGPADDAEDMAYAVARKGLVGTVEPNTFIIKISFRHTDAKASSLFTNELINVFISRRAELYSNPGAASFFKAQEGQYNNDLAQASALLERFQAETGIFSIDEQKRLALARRDAIFASLVATRGSIKRIESQSDSMKFQISALKTRITLPPEIYGDTKFNGDASKLGRVNDALWSDPPLLHVKLYQQMAEKLVETNAELSGLRALEEQQAKDLKATDSQLKAVAGRENEFNRLQRDVARAANFIESFRKRNAEAKIDNAWLLNDTLSSIQVFQPATTPVDPVFPKPKLLLATGLSLGLLFAVALAFILASRRSAEALGTSPFRGPLNYRASLEDSGNPGGSPFREPAYSFGDGSQFARTAESTDGFSRGHHRN